jgi:FkbM family methyltransferase
MKNYSQTTEQQVILEYFKGVTGCFCDIGANDGVTFSNSYALAQIGWHGAYVEASPRAFKKLQDNIKPLNKGQLELHNVALDKANGGKILMESGPLVTKDDIALVSTFHDHEMDRFRKSVRYSPVGVSCMDWKTLLENSVFKTFDFISMDIEGSELDVLPQMDLSEVRLFCIEWNGNAELEKAYSPYFEGFRLIHTTAENLIYAR